MLSNGQWRQPHGRTCVLASASVFSDFACCFMARNPSLNASIISFCSNERAFLISLRRHCHADERPETPDEARL